MGVAWSFVGVAGSFVGVARLFVVGHSALCPLAWSFREVEWPLAEVECLLAGVACLLAGECRDRASRLYPTKSVSLTIFRLCIVNNLPAIVDRMGTTMSATHGFGVLDDTFVPYKPLRNFVFRR